MYALEQDRKKDPMRKERVGDIVCWTGKDVRLGCGEIP